MTDPADLIEEKLGHSGGQTDFIVQATQYMRGHVRIRRWHSSIHPAEEANRIFVCVGEDEAGEKTVHLTRSQAVALLVALGKALAIPLSPGEEG